MVPLHAAAIANSARGAVRVKALKSPVAMPCSRCPIFALSAVAGVAG